MTGALGDGDLSKWRLRSLLAHFRNIGIDHEAVWNSYLPYIFHPCSSFMLSMFFIAQSFELRIRNVIRLSLLPLAKDMKTPKPRCFELFGFGTPFIPITQDLPLSFMPLSMTLVIPIDCSL